MNAVLGGTFDPIHEGHLHLIQSLLKTFSFEHLYLIPAGRNPHKKEAPLAGGTDRLEMVRLAAGGLSDKVRVLDWEVLSPPPNYTVATLERMHREGMAPLTLVMGDDVYAGFPRWREPERVRELAELLVVTRGHQAPDSTHRLKRFVFDPLPISATSLRRDIHKLWKSNHLTHCPQGLPPSVWAYIKKKKLYTESPT